MATDYYNLPTVNDTNATFSFVDALNALAVSVDSETERIRRGFNRDEYELPIATKEQLGGVRIGDGWDLYSDGMIRAKETSYTLPAATDKRLGGIIAGENIVCDPATGTIRIDEKAYKFNAFTEQQLAADCVSTTKLIDGAVEEAKLATSVYSTILNIRNIFNNAKIRQFNVRGTSYEMYDPGAIVAMTVGNVSFFFWYPNQSQGKTNPEDSYTIQAAADGTTISTLLKKSLKLYLLGTKTGLNAISNTESNWYGFDGALQYGVMTIQPGSATCTVACHNSFRFGGSYQKFGMPIVQMVTKE